MQTEELKFIYAKKAAEAYRKKDTQDWISALFCSRIVGNYERGATLGLASDMGVSTDTIEDRAHAYMLFERLCKLDGGKFRLFIFNARRLPYIYLSHFRALYDHQISYSLTDDQILDLLMDVVQGEGNISSRNLENHIRSRYGDMRDWSYWGGKALKELNKTISHPGFPNSNEPIGSVYEVDMSVSDDVGKLYRVLAYHETMAEKIAREELSKEFGEKVGTNSTCLKIEKIGDVITGSRNIVNITTSWLGDNS